MNAQGINDLTVVHLLKFILNLAPRAVGMLQTPR